MTVNAVDARLNAARCWRCGQYWCFTSGPAASFKAITKWCPLCIAIVLPVMGGLAVLPTVSGRSA